jgi:hypothetical protein
VEKQIRPKRVATTVLMGLFAASFGISGLWTASIADTSVKPEALYPLEVKQRPPKGEGGWRDDTLIVVANPRSTKEDLDEALQEVKGNSWSLKQKRESSKRPTKIWSKTSSISLWFSEITLTRKSNAT